MSNQAMRTGPRVSLLEALKQGIAELMPETLGAPRADLIRRELIEAERRIDRARHYAVKNLREAEQKAKDNPDSLPRHRQLEILAELGVKPELPARALLEGGVERWE